MFGADMGPASCGPYLSWVLKAGFSCRTGVGGSVASASTRWRGKRRGGTGLGLYIVKGLVEALGGDITVGRAPGGGAEFRFTVPAGAPVA